MNSSRGFLLSLAVLLLCCAMAFSQLTFSPYWGKRSSGDLLNLFESQKGDCRNANEMLADIFRFIQMKAQSFSECNQG